ncbi:hypothetical protein [Maribacter dokdonensis]|uniref:hypothetical protein n=1 Tax=Maribacter dokdonensis TaxID=320912 RepID=UPI001114AFE7|nr:hypothetical protein [Maribacter dokdonensis]
MNKTTFVIFVMMVILDTYTISSQTSNTTVATATNVAFAPLEKNRIPNNILLDYGMELIDITKYDGVFTYR